MHIDSTHRGAAATAVDDVANSAERSGRWRRKDRDRTVMERPIASSAGRSANPQDAKPPVEAAPSVTVIVPVRNEERHIASTLDQLLDQRQDGIAVEILVMDGRSTDSTRDIVAGYEQRYPQVRLLDNPGLFSSSARNIAIDQSQGDYLVVIDGHCEIPSRTYLQDLVSAFQRTRADCLGRPQPLDVSRATTLQKAIAAARSSPLGHHPASYIYSAEELEVPAGSVAVAYRRNVFDRVGKFDPNFDACEDYELNHRIDQAGMKCYLVPSLAVQYHPRESLGWLIPPIGPLRPRPRPHVAQTPRVLFSDGLCAGRLFCRCPCRSTHLQLGARPVVSLLAGDWGVSRGDPRGVDSRVVEREEPGPAALAALCFFGGASGLRLGSHLGICISRRTAMTPYEPFLQRYRDGEWRAKVFRDLILNEIDKLKTAPVILDIGCGSGFDGSEKIQGELAERSEEYIGVEPDEQIEPMGFVDRLSSVKV